MNELGGAGQKEMLRVASLNCNGLRSCLRKGLAAWLAAREPDVLCLQEVRARRQDLEIENDRCAGLRCYFFPAQRLGYAGVAIFSREQPKEVRPGFGAEIFDSEGRWLQADFGSLSVVSLYLPSGSAGELRQAVKYRCMDLLFERLRALASRGRKVIVAGDFNIAHTAKDIRNAKSNRQNSGFLPVERAWLGAVIDELGWVDALRAVDDSSGLYTWWSQRSGARQRNVGWRIDYQLASPSLAGAIKAVAIDSQPLLSDHAPVVADYCL